MSNLHDRRRSRRSRDLFTWLIVGVLLLAELAVGYLLGYYLLGETVLEFPPTLVAIADEVIG
jgi:hypothetical protein